MSATSRRSPVFVCISCEALHAHRLTPVQKLSALTLSTFLDFNLQKEKLFSDWSSEVDSLKCAMLHGGDGRQRCRIRSGCVWSLEFRGQMSTLLELELKPQLRVLPHICSDYSELSLTRSHSALEMESVCVCVCTCPCRSIGPLMVISERAVLFTAY